MNKPAIYKYNQNKLMIEPINLIISWITTFIGPKAKAATNNVIISTFNFSPR